MSCRDVHDLAGWVVDSLKFAADGDCITGKLAVADLPRLVDVVSGSVTGLDCRLAGYREADRFGTGQSQHVLHLQVTGKLGMRCERCLADVEVDCAVDTRLLLVPEGRPWPEDEMESDEYDAIPASRELSVLELVEEEVLLALPLVPRHEVCSLPADAGAVEGSGAASPFAALAGLKKH